MSEYFSVHELAQSMHVATEVRHTIEQGLLFQCNNRELISMLSKCDGIIDCLDASDEINCSIYTGSYNNLMQKRLQDYPWLSGLCH